MKPEVRSINILLAEDEENDVELTQRALKEGKLHNHMDVVSDGIELLSYLRKENQYSNKLRPDLILLDLNMPKKSGIESLYEIKSDPKLKSIPVVILTSSSSEDDIAQSYEKHANCYVRKPLGLDDFGKIVQAIEKYWIDVVELPSQTRKSNIRY